MLYAAVIGAVKRVDSLKRFVLLNDGTMIPIEDILKIAETF